MLNQTIRSYVTFLVGNHDNRGYRIKQVERLHCSTDKNETWRQSLLCGRPRCMEVYQQQFVKLTACIRSDASSKRTWPS